jgi:glyoxylase-like metal-dependent hydrolase (beta-lactamase superfamily II)
MRVGELDVLALVDANGTFATVSQAFPALDSGEAWWLPINTVLVRGPEATVLIDTGLGPKPRAFMSDAEAHLPRELAQALVDVEEIDLVVHTHLHVDHVGWNGAFPNARYVVHGDDWSFFSTEESITQRPHLREKVLPLIEAGLVDLVHAETLVAPGVRAVPTPGHTPGHMSVWIESGGDGLAVLGDVVVHEAQLADPDLVYVSDGDPGAAALTRKDVLGRLADEEAKVIVSHFEGVGRFTRRNGGFRWSGAKEDAPPVE